ncbi:uncharacterized protein LOC130948203 isoform X1 [Arachis stenosperma]|uniref:uncharacterized protein LOC130948203 isoform X1 n=1 Tax=Arachis stenosperma TaxID=217475 RepID=UPI0025AC359C|nr:uncharacterized protein LOC130948203 isoform X1 [Arachis stenosperma]
MSESGSASSLVAETVWKEIESTRTVSDDQLWTLHFIFGKNMEGAARIVDQRGVSRISGNPSGRFVFQVTGESPRKKDHYLCFPHHFCACYSFFYDVLNRRQQLSWLFLSRISSCAILFIIKGIFWLKLRDLSKNLIQRLKRTADAVGF